MRDRLLQTLSHCGADYADVRVEREWSSAVLYRKDNLENLESSSEMGGIVRCLVGGGWGVAVFNSLDELERRVEDACRIAKTVSAKVSQKADLAAVKPVQDEVRVALQKDPRYVPLQDKQRLLQTYNELMLGSSDQIVTTMARYADSFREITFASSQDAYVVEERPDVTLLLSATARNGDTNIQEAFESEGWVAGFEAAEGQEELAQRAAQRAVDLLQARPVQGGAYTVILDPLLTGVFIHEAFGHLCEADFISKNPRLQEILTPGRRFGVPELNVIDDGYLPGLRGNSKYDDEGTPRKKVYLIRKGVLHGFLHSRETAARLGATPTGNARAVSYQCEPIVRMRNTYIDQGSATFEQMLKGVERGIYACNAFGGQTEMEQFTFSAAYAYEIVNGKLGGMLRDVVLTGNVFETLQNIDLIGSDLQIKGGAGGCGKAGQSPLPVSMGGPHVRIRNLTVGGRVE